MDNKKFSWRSLFGGCLTKVENVPSPRPSTATKESSFTRLSYLDVSCQTSAADLSSSLSGSNLCTFTMAELKVVTQNFSISNVIGQGGFGPVYKGFIDEKIKPDMKPQTVAVKLLDLEGVQGHKEWLTEVIMLGQLSDPHLVKLIGYCYEDEHRLLVYEYMSRGSLENHLFKRFCATLPWQTRIQIAIGAAKGLKFLHGADQRVIYRDFKASNILLDSDYQAKLSDFGLAKDGPQGDDTHVSTRVMGTQGYAAPEYVMTGHLTTKSDVYGFGVVLLELLTGRRSVDKTRPSREQNLVDWAKSSLNDPRKLGRIMDPSLEGQYSTEGARRAAALAHMCLSHLPKHRPNMKAVVNALEPLQELNDIPLGTFVFTAVEENVNEGNARNTDKDDNARKTDCEERAAKAKEENARPTQSQDTARRSPRHQQQQRHRIPSPKSACYTDTALYRKSPRHQHGRGT